MKHPPLLLALLAAASVTAQTVTLFDFTGSRQNGWFGNERVESVTPTPEGLRVVCPDVSDPWVEGPVCPDLPEGDYERIVIEFTCRLWGSNNVELFFGPTFSGGFSVVFSPKADGSWETFSAIIPRLPPKSRFRLDPSLRSSTMVLATIRATPLIPRFTPASKPLKAVAAVHTVTAGRLTLRHGDAWDTLAVSYGQKLLATGDANPVLRTDGGETRLATLKPTFAVADGSLRVSLDTPDCRLERVVTAVPERETIRVRDTLTPLRDLGLLHHAPLTLFPGHGSFGARKSQALLSGVEYLLDEPSSDPRRDLEGTAANRLSVSPHKLCQPLMAIAADGHWLSLSWDYARQPLTVFDSPDRQFGSGAHLFALWWPGLQGRCRLEGDLKTYGALPLRAGQPLSLEYELSAGEGDTVTPATERYLESHPLPPLPSVPTFQEAIALLSRGLLHSAICKGEQGWLHNYVPRQPEHPAIAGDAIIALHWLLRHSDSETLRQAIRDRLAAVMPGFHEGKHGWHFSSSRGVVATHLYFGTIASYLTYMPVKVANDLKAFRPDGTVPYEIPKPPALHYGRTHWADHANAYTAARLVQAANLALFSGNPDIRQSFLRTLDAFLVTYRHDIPRGGQTWEVPLHTPDLVGSYSITELCLVAYGLTHDARYLAEARHWLLTGVPFIYLLEPASTGGPVGAYASIAVFGGTEWIWSWIGKPVQWCGLGFATVLLDSLPVMPEKERARWRQLAQGIQRTAINMVWPTSDAQLGGLLPDAFHFDRQSRDFPAIHPVGVISALSSVYGVTPIYEIANLATGVSVTALGKVTPAGQNAVELDLWPEQETQALISGLAARPAAVLWRGKPVEFAWLDEHRAFIVRLKGQGRLTWQ